LTSPRVIVGLGNPGSKYQRTRHNLGFLVIDEILSRSGGRGSEWKEQFGALTVKVRFASDDCLLVKPQSFMNRSGEPLRDVLSFFKIEAQHIVVVHDEVDIPFGSLRIKQGGGDGGHNGLKSITQLCGGPGYTRVRVGVGRPLNPSYDLAAWVLERLSNEEERALPSLLGQVVQAVEVVCVDGLVAAQNRFNTVLI
jgi:PTH1 family peptidyl-tRNA hydrolase